jgi:hypothetical protein
MERHNNAKMKYGASFIVGTQHLTPAVGKFYYVKMESDLYRLYNYDLMIPFNI